ncbi:MAG: Alpha/Beta hydrolase protein [Benniella sp.]|nr:MAG: Alpha/Beta hydrolase protein [Benniella sp.]
MPTTTEKPRSKEEWIKADDGLEIFTKTWYPVDKPVATVVFVHGLGEHIVRYDHVFEEFNKHGIQVSAFDQRGFGRTGQKTKTLGRTGGYAKAIPDITAALKRGKIKGLPLFLMGHSYGGSLVLNYNCIGPLRKKLSGLIASAPLVLASAPTRPNSLTVSFAGAVSRIAPSLKVPINLSSKYISRDPKEVAKYNADPLVHGYGTTKGLYDMLNNGKLLLTTRYKVIARGVPLLITHGTADGLTDANASKAFFEKINVKDKEYKVYEGYFHELHNEPEPDRSNVINYYIQWILKHLKEKEGGEGEGGDGDDGDVGGDDDYLSDAVSAAEAAEMDIADAVLGVSVDVSSSANNIPSADNSTSADYSTSVGHTTSVGHSTTADHSTTTDTTTTTTSYD